MILIKKYADQKERIALSKDLDKKLKNAEKAQAKSMREKKEKLDKMLTKQNEVVSKFKYQIKNETRVAMQRMQQYDDEQKEREERYRQQTMAARQ